MDASRDTHPRMSPQERLDRLLQAIELVENNQRTQALPILRQLIQLDNDFEDAWLWMSVAVDDVDQSAVCLDNVLRINPNNARAAEALYRLREGEILSENRRSHLRMVRDMALVGMWLTFFSVIVAILVTYSRLFTTS